MGKNKAQRTKNNARPSSSGRSAQLLESSSFVGFPTLAEGGFTLPVLAGLTGLQLDEGESQSVSPQLQLVLKKMNKKDAITRLKALQEFAELCQSVEEEEIKAVLRFWPRMFSVLATDPDHRVREAAHKAHHQLSKRSGRNIAPHLRSLAGPWFVGQFDSFAPGASAACQAFQDAFPGPKYPEAIKYCQKEILTYITENLLSQTVETVAYEKSLSADELDARMERVLSSNLLAYQQYLRNLPASELKQAYEQNKNLIMSPKFWKLNKHKSALVRRTWFSTLAALLHEVPDLLMDQGALVAPAVFGNLDESDPCVLPAVWEATLHALVTIKDCWSHVNCEKMVFPKLWHILKAGGQGNATAIYPNLLPLLSKITPQDKSSFYFKFFSNMQLGLGQKMVQHSSAETGAIINGYMDCFRYVVKIEKDVEFIKQLLNEQLLHLLESCTTERASHHTLNPLAVQMSALLTSWMSDDKLSPLSSIIWEHLTNISNSLSEKENPEGAFQSFVDFIVMLVSPTKIKKTRKVNFSLEEVQEETNEEDPIETVPYTEPLTLLGFGTSKHVFKACKEAKFAEPYINNLLKLSIAFHSQEFFSNLEESGIQLFTETLLPWMISSEISAKPVVQISFLLLTSLDTKDMEHIFSLFCKLEDKGVLQLCIAECLQSGKHNQKVMSWFKSQELHDVLVELAKEVANVLQSANSDKITAWAILKLCFTSVYEGGLVIRSETISEILRVFCDALTVSSEELKDDAALDSCAKFVGELTNSLFSQQLKLCQVTLQELLLATFKLCCARRGLSETARESLQNAWKNGTQYLNLSTMEMHNLCEKFSKFAHENFTLLNTQSVACSAQFISVTKDEDVSQIFLKLPDKYLQWQEQLEDVLYVTLVVTNSYFWTKDKPVPVVTNLDCLFNYMNSILFNVNLLQELYKLPPDEFSDVLDDDFTNEKLIEATYALCLCTKIINEYKNNRTCYKMIVDLDVLTKNFTEVIEKVSKKDVQKIVLHALEEMKKGNQAWMWVLPQITSWRPNMKEVLVREFSSTPSESWDNWKIWLIQAVPMLLTYEVILSSLTVQTSKELSLESLHCAIFTLLHDKNISDEQLKSFLQLFSKLRKMNKLDKVFGDDTLEVNDFVSVGKLLAHMIRSKPWVISAAQWDLILCSLVIWMQEGKEYLLKHPTNPEYASMLSVLCLLMSSVQGFMNRLQEDDELKAKSPKHLIEEWNSLFVPEAYKILMALFYAAIENTKPSLWEQFKLRMIGLSLARVPVKWLLAHEPPKHLTKSFKRLTVQDKNIEDFCRILCSLLHSSERAIQVTAYHLFTKLVSELVEKDDAYRLSEDSESVETNKLSCELLGMELTTTHAVMEAMLMDFRVGDCCIVEPFTDSHLYTQAYLLTWGILFDLCKEAKSELRYQYARWLSNTGYTHSMLQIIFRLMPDYVVHPFFESKAIFTPSNRCINIFTQEYFPSFTGYHTASGIQQAACWVYKRSLQNLPALVRAWWNECDVHVAGMVDRLTSALVSPLVCAAEMRAVHEHEKNFSNMTVKVHQMAREVVAVYTVDDVCMELTIILPTNHPLGPVKVEGNKPAIDIAKWKQWVMQLTVFLTHQNGSIWDGLMLWKRNLDNKFGGVEECYICYSVLHGTSYQIPKLSCHTCHKKFHSSCLYRWFHTSNNSTCPICRHLF